MVLPFEQVGQDTEMFPILRCGLPHHKFIPELRPRSKVAVNVH